MYNSKHCDHFFVPNGCCTGIYNTHVAWGQWSAPEFDLIPTGISQEVHCAGHRVEIFNGASAASAEEHKHLEGSKVCKEEQSLLVAVGLFLLSSELSQFLTLSEVETVAIPWRPSESLTELSQSTCERGKRSGGAPIL